MPKKTAPINKKNERIFFMNFSLKFYALSGSFPGEVFRYLLEWERGHKIILLHKN
jgi:hypothetical protein